MFFDETGQAIVRIAFQWFQDCLTITFNGQGPSNDGMAFTIGQVCQSN